MKEGFLKKVAIGVAVSLVSMAVVAGFSGLFGGTKNSEVFEDDTSSVSNICTHENRTTYKGIEPTCTVSGLSSVNVCLDCGKPMTKAEELPALGHTGELGKTCGFCKEPIYGEYINSNNYTLVPVSEGEKVVGNWYRFQTHRFDQSYLDYNNGIGDGMVTVSSCYIKLKTGEEQEYFIGLDTGNIFFFEGIGCMPGDQVDKFFPVVDVVIPKDGKYIDVYVQEVTSLTLVSNPEDTEPITVSLTEDTVITSTSQYVQKIVFN